MHLPTLTVLIVDKKAFNSEFAIFVKYKWIIKKIIFEPSLRLHYYASQSALSPEPRIAMKYNVSKNVCLKLAAGLYTQNIMSATSDQTWLIYFTDS